MKTIKNHAMRSVAGGAALFVGTGAAAVEAATNTVLASLALKHAHDAARMVSKTYKAVGKIMQKTLAEGQRRAYAMEASRNMHNSYDHVSLDRWKGYAK